MLYRAWRWLCAVAVQLFIKLHLYKLKSQLYRALFERKYRDVKIGVVARLARIPPIIDHGKKWRADGWRELFDAVSSPQRCQQIFLGLAPVPRSGLDCDEHAIYVAAVLKESLEAGLCGEDGVANPRFFTVVWMDPKTWKPYGHNVCLLEVPQPGKYFPMHCYMDYGLPSQAVQSISDVAAQVVAHYAPGAEVLVWAVQGVDLTPEMVCRS